MTVLMFCCGSVPQGWADNEAARKNSESSAIKPAPDLSARKRVGKASFYAPQFSGKTMANGAPMDPQGDNAASRTLPLGTRAKAPRNEETRLADNSPP